MTLKYTLVAFILAFVWLEGIFAASFSNVLVQRGPLEYISYNPSSVSFSSPQLAQLSAAPLEEVVPIPAVSSIVSPCVAPCVIPNSPALTPLSSSVNAKIFGYRSSLPNVPVLLENKDEAKGYQYAYAVFDEQTGDKKSQSEHSDGFNAVVRNISPEQEHPKEETPEVTKEGKHSLPPCTEVKNEHLTDNPANNEDSLEENRTEIEHMEDKKSAEKSAEHSSEKIENQSHAEAHPDSKPTDNNPNIPNALVSYNDIINCLQAKLQGTTNIVSPLTYILIPSLRSPC